MTKKEVQKRILRHGKKIALTEFSWDEKTNTFSSELNDLVIDFKFMNDCTFKTGYYCTFKTGYSCTFKTGSCCTFDTGSCCTFDTGSDCTFDTGSSCTFKTGQFCVVIRRDKFQIIKLKENFSYQLCPYNIPGYIYKREGDEDWYRANTHGEEVEHIIADGILSKVIYKKKNIWKVLNYGESKESYLINKDGKTAHGSTIKEAKESLVYKFKNVDKSEYEGLELSHSFTKEEAIQCYHTITGACSSGIKYFIDQNDVKGDSFTIKKMIKITDGAYGSQEFKDFFNKN